MPEFHSFEEYAQFAREEEKAAEERGHLTEEDWRRIRIGLAMKQVSRESYFDVMDGFITVDQAFAIGYEESLEYQVQWHQDVYTMAERKEKRLISEARRGVRQPHPCLCGCGEMCKGTFAQGHDMKMKGKLNRGEIHEGNITDEQRRFAKKHGKEIKPAPVAEPVEA